MARITKQELEKFARISCIYLPESEIDKTIEKMSAVLEYAQRVQEIAQQKVALNVEIKNNNVFREDVPQPFNAQAILACGPEVEESFFIVPKIIKHP